MKFLFFRTTGGISGAEIYTQCLIDALKKQHHEATIITDNREWKRVLTSNNIETVYFPNTTKEIGIKRTTLAALMRYPAYIQSFEHILSSYSPKATVVVFESLNEKIFASWLVAKMGFRLVWIEHGPLFRTNMWSMVKTAYRRVSGYPDTIIAVSSDTKRDLQTGGIPPEKIVTVPIGVPERKHPVKVGNSKNTITIGFLGSLNEKKGFLDFLRIVQRLRTHPKLRFCAIGSGPLEDYTKDFIASHELDTRFSFRSFLPGERPDLTGIDYMVFPTHHEEGTSIALLEALTSSCIVFARDIGGNRELIYDGVTGYLLPNHASAQDFVSKIEDVLKKRIKSIDPEAISTYLHTHYDSQTQAKRIIGCMLGNGADSSLPLPSYSLCIPTYKRPDDVIRLLGELSLQIHKPQNIYIVEQGKNNKNRIEQAAEKYSLPVVYRFLPIPSMTKARNTAIGLCTSDILLFCDDDISPSKQWAGELCRGLIQTGADAITGRTVTAGQPEEPKYAKTGRFTALGGVTGGYSSTIPQYIDSVLGCNCGFRMDIFRQVGLFDEQFTGNALREESDMSRRIQAIGGTIAFWPAAEVIHLRAKQGGARKTEGRLFWYFHFFSNETYFFLKHFPHLLFPLFLVSKTEWILRCAFGFGREVSIASLLTPLRGILDGKRKYNRMSV